MFVSIVTSTRSSEFQLRLFGCFPFFRDLLNPSKRKGVTKGIKNPLMLKVHKNADVCIKRALNASLFGAVTTIDQGLLTRVARCVCVFSLQKCTPSRSMYVVFVLVFYL